MTADTSRELVERVLVARSFHEGRDPRRVSLRRRSTGRGELTYSVDFVPAAARRATPVVR